MTPDAIRRECEALERGQAALEQRACEVNARLDHLRNIVCSHPERVGQSCVNGWVTYLCADCGKVFWPSPKPKVNNGDRD